MKKSINTEKESEVEDYLMKLLNKEAFDNEIISEYEYNKIQKSLLSQKILKNNINI